MDSEEEMETTGPGWWYRPIVIRDPKKMKDPVLVCRTQGNSIYCKANDETRIEASGKNTTDDGGKVFKDEMAGKNDKKRANVCVDDNIVYPCEICSRVFPSKRSLGSHLRAHYPKIIFLTPPEIKSQNFTDEFGVVNGSDADKK